MSNCQYSLHFEASARTALLRGRVLLDKNGRRYDTTYIYDMHSVQRATAILGTVSAYPFGTITVARYCTSTRQTRIENEGSEFSLLCFTRPNTREVNASTAAHCGFWPHPLGETVKLIVRFKYIAVFRLSLPTVRASYLETLVEQDSEALCRATGRC